MLTKKHPAITLLLCCSFLAFSLSVSAQSPASAPDSLTGCKNVYADTIFPGGPAGWRKFMEKNLDPNVPVKNGAPDGTYTVLASFTIEENGNISDIKALTNHGYGMEQEVIRLLKKIAVWVPVVENGQQVKAYRKLPVFFKIISDNPKRTRLPASRQANKA